MSDDVIQARLARIEEKLDGLATLQAKVDKFLDPLESLMDLKRDLSILAGPGVRLLTEELAEVETGFQLEDFFFLLKKLLLSLRHLAWSLEQLENLRDWWQDMEPLLRIAIPHLIDKLDDLEQKGIFRINKAMLDMYVKLAATFSPEDIDAIADGFVRLHAIAKKFAEPVVVQSLEAVVGMYAKLAAVYKPEDIEAIGDGFVLMHGIVRKFADPMVIRSLEALVDTYAKLAMVYKPEDIEAIGDGFVRMHGIVKKFADSRVIDFLNRLTDVPARVDLQAAAPVGPLGLPFRLMNKECKEGLGVVLELTRALGRIKSADNGSSAGEPEPGKSENLS